MTSERVGTPIFTTRAHVFVYVSIWCSGLCDKTGAVRALTKPRGIDKTRLLLMRARASKGCAAVCPLSRLSVKKTSAVWKLLWLRSGWHHLVWWTPPFRASGSRKYCTWKTSNSPNLYIVSVVLFVWQPSMCELIMKSGQWNLVLVPGWWR